MKNDHLITGITVCSNTLDLIRCSYDSVRKFHPEMKIIIIDGSDEKDACYEFVSSLASKNTFPIQVGYNIGHGRGMCVGVHYTETPFALIFDSDIKMLKSPVQKMFDMMEEDTFGVGYTEFCGLDGFEYGVHPHHKLEPKIKYLHPYFHLLQIKNYRKFYPYVHHGAPSFLTMVDIHKKGLSDKIIKEFPGLGHSTGIGYTWESSPREYVRHDIAGTRRSRISKGQKSIEGSWETNKGQV
jgi:hypothetical protein